MSDRPPSTSEVLPVALFALAIAFAFVPVTVAPAEAGTLQPTTALGALFRAARDPAADFDAKRFHDLEANSTSADLAPLRPMYAFLDAEAQRIRGDAARARAIDREMLDWCGRDPYRDGSGASALCPVALWRLLSGDGGDVGTQRALLRDAVRYWNAKGRLAEGLFGASPILGALPQLREAILGRMIELAWSLGEKDQAYGLLRDYLQVARDWPLTALEEQVLAEGTAAKAIDEDRLLLALGVRLLDAGKTETARSIFIRVQRAGDATIAADARLQLARLLRDSRGRACATPELRAEIDAVLAASRDPDLRQRARLFRALKYLQRGCPVDTAQFEADLAQLRAEFPHAHATFVATTALASFYLDRWLDVGDGGALERALAHFADARALIPSETSTSPRIQEQQAAAWFKPALAIYARGTHGDRRSALALLRALDERWPDGPLRLNTRFWRARIAAELGSREEARTQWLRIIDDSPYDYYALRAHLWLAHGRSARKAVNLDSRTRSALAEAYSSSAKQFAALHPGSPYHVRLRAAVTEDVYPAALASLVSLRKEALPGRALEDASMEELDATHRLVDVAMALALRQDALFAAEQPASARNRLEVARTVGHWASKGWLQGDWTLSVLMTAPRRQADGQRLELQQDALFLAAAYPDAYRTFIEESAARWKVPAELLYAVVRTETAFNPSAESTSAALGLFQFIPPTFRDLNARWHVVGSNDQRAREAFLLTPESNIQLGARWFAQVLLDGQQGNVLWALMAHNAGPHAVSQWKSMWRRLGRADDLEFMVESARFDETRGFARRSLTAMWIADAAGVPARLASEARREVERR